MTYHVMIPARYASVRLPGKLLLNLRGKPILQHTYEQCKKSNAKSITILTDDERIKVAAEKFGADVQMTSPDCLSGTDRIIEAIRYRHLPLSTLIVNVQADEPFIDPILINQVANCIIQHKTGMATLAFPIRDESEIHNRNVVKAVQDAHGFAQYFTRVALTNGGGEYLRHIGIYAYTAEFLLKMADLPPSPTQLAESLEQLKVLWYGEKIYLDIAAVPPQQDINTLEDYEKLIQSTQ